MRIEHSINGSIMGTDGYQGYRLLNTRAHFLADIIQYQQIWGTYSFVESILQHSAEAFTVQIQAGKG